ncbi:hypothetical protein Q1695_003317 [Nippostrongylus brasiliensis]|nr:hypothetical protein Q1695_003317 [Nippostrongylus brasiliensis]
MQRGTCLQFSVNWFYDRYAHRCRRFFYGGCEGNDNRFSTLEECNASCNFREPTNRDRCFQPHDPGHCSSDIERWYYDKDKGQCVCSWWSGCGGNSNLFYSYNHCMLICGEFVRDRTPGYDERRYGNRSRPAVGFGGTYVTQWTQWQPQTQQQAHQWDLSRGQETQWHPQPQPIGDQSHSRQDGGWTSSRPHQGHAPYVEHVHTHQREAERFRGQRSGFERPAPQQSPRSGYERHVPQERGHSGYERPAPQESRRSGYERPTSQGGHQSGYERPTPHREPQSAQQQHIQDTRYNVGHSAQGQHQRGGTHYVPAETQQTITFSYHTGAPESRSYHTGYVRESAAPASRYTEFRSSNSMSSASQSSFHQHSDQSSKTWEGVAIPRTHGQRIYRYDTGPVRTVHPNGTITIKHDVYYYSPIRYVDTRREQQHMDQAPIPEQLAAELPPELLQRLKQIMKAKVPPRRIYPGSPLQPTSLPNPERSSERQQQIWGTAFTTPAAPLQTFDSRQTPAYRPQSQSIASSAQGYAEGPQPPSSRSNPQGTSMNGAAFSQKNPVPMILPSYSPPGPPAEYRETYRTNNLPTSPKRVDFDEVIAMDSEAEDDYVEPRDYPNYPSVPSYEHRKETSTPEPYHVKSQLPPATLKPIVHPPAGYPYSYDDADRILNNGRGTHHPLQRTSSTHLSAHHSAQSAVSTTPFPPVDDYPEEVEFNIEPVGVRKL